MKIVIKTSVPNGLLQHIKDTINDAKRSSFKTWAIVKSTTDTEFFVHSTPDKQWEDVLLKPVVNTTAKTLTLESTTWTSKKITHDQRAYVIGRMVEQLLAHVKDKFTVLEIS